MRNSARALIVNGARRANSHFPGARRRSPLENVEIASANRKSRGQIDSMILNINCDSAQMNENYCRRLQSWMHWSRSLKRGEIRFQRGSGANYCLRNLIHELSRRWELCCRLLVDLTLELMRYRRSQFNGFSKNFSLPVQAGKGGKSLATRWTFLGKSDDLSGSCLMACLRRHFIRRFTSKDFRRNFGGKFFVEILNKFSWKYWCQLMWKLWSKLS